jgi:hypothetical protein
MASRTTGSTTFRIEKRPGDDTPGIVVSAAALLVKFQFHLLLSRRMVRREVLKFPNPDQIAVYNSSMYAARKPLLNIRTFREKIGYFPYTQAKCLHEKRLGQA